MPRGTVCFDWLNIHHIDILSVRHSIRSLPGIQTEKPAPGRRTSTLRVLARTDDPEPKSVARTHDSHSGRRKRPNGY